MPLHGPCLSLQKGENDFDDEASDQEVAALYTAIHAKYKWSDGNDDEMGALLGAVAKDGVLQRSQFAVLERIGQGQFGVVSTLPSSKGEESGTSCSVFEVLERIGQGQFGVVCIITPSGGVEFSTCFFFYFEMLERTESGQFVCLVWGVRVQYLCFSFLYREWPVWSGNAHIVSYCFLVG